MKRLTALLLAFVLTFQMVACSAPATDPVEEDKEVIADVVEPKVHTISFENVFGEENLFTDIKVVDGKLVEKPADPVREGYTFVGWFTSEDSEVPFDFEKDIVTEDTVLFARWEKNAPKAPVAPAPAAPVTQVTDTPAKVNKKVY